MSYLSMQPCRIYGAQARAGPAIVGRIYFGGQVGNSSERVEVVRLEELVVVREARLRELFPSESSLTDTVCMFISESVLN